MIVLGIETSCDETAVAVVTGEKQILSNIVLSQLEEHRPYGGVVPEIAARSHLDYMDGLVERALREADLGLDDLTGIAATGGPGLIGGVIVGAMTGKAIAAVKGLPFVAVNHLEAHALTARLTNGVAFPYLLLLVSGGHCQILAVEGVGRYKRLGTTIDDAAGEAFDKVAKMLGLPYPGGPAVEKAAREGNAKRFALPRPMKGREGCDFSFSGLKTAVRRVAEGLPGGRFSDRDVADLCASFQAALAESIMDRVGRALALRPDCGVLVVSGGVAANGMLRQALKTLAGENGVSFAAPPLPLCTDNGAMIAWAGIERLQLGLSDPLDFKPRPRWPLVDEIQQMGPAQ